MSENLIIMGASGRMGSTICRLAKDDGFNLVAVLDIPTRLDELKAWHCLIGSQIEEILPQALGAVIIDFTSPETSLANARIAAAYKNPIVIGTTGLSAIQKSELEDLAKQTPLFWSPNMSVGINVLLDILPQLARMLGPEYDLELVEIHHNKKKDSPSGTALRLAESLAQGHDVNLHDVACYHREGIIGERPQGQIGVQTIRGGDVAGVHTAYFLGQGERIEITHHAHSRENFARGALRAAKWLAKQQAGQLYSMQDVIHS